MLHREGRLTVAAFLTGLQPNQRYKLRGAGLLQGLPALTRDFRTSAVSTQLSRGSFGG
jgi:hypothetical protein